MISVKIKDVVFHDKIINAGEFQLYFGKVTALIGESGCGKTTILHSLTFQNDFLDSLIVGQSEITEQDEKERFFYEHIGKVEQKPEFLKDLTIQQHIDLIKDIYGIKENNLEYIEILEVKDILHKYPDQLSGGEQIRCAILLALIHEPDILILDEPTSSLDEYHSEIIWKVVSSYAKNGNVVVISTHDSHIIEQSDVVYQIQDHQIQKVKLISDDADVEIKEKYKKKNLIGLSYYFRKMRKHKVIYHRIVRILAVFCIGFLVFSYEFNNIAYAVQTKQMNEMASRELLVYNGVNRQGFIAYDFSGMNDLISQREIDEIRQIPHVVDVEWRADVDIFQNVAFPVTDKVFSSIDYVPESVKILNENELYKEICMGRNEQCDINTGSMIVSSYIKDFDYSADIEYQFQNEGVYLSMPIAKKICDDPEELREKKISFVYYVPVNDSYGKVWTYSKYDDIVNLHAPDIVPVKVILPIAGILKYSNMGVYNTGQEVIYMDRDIIEKYINEYRSDKTRTIYGMDIEYKKYYVDEIPDKEKENVVHEVKQTPWTPTGYSVIVDDLGNIGDVINEITNMGLCVENGYVNYSAVRQATKNMSTAIKVAAMILSMIIFIVYTVMKFNNREHARDVNHYFSTLGLTKKEIRKVKNKMYIEESIVVAVYAVLIFTLLMFGCNILHIGYTVYSLKMIVMIFMLSLIFEAILPMLMEFEKS